MSFMDYRVTIQVDVVDHLQEFNRALAFGPWWLAFGVWSRACLSEPSLLLYLQVFL